MSAFHIGMVIGGMIGFAVGMVTAAVMAHGGRRDEDPDA